MLFALNTYEARFTHFLTPLKYFTPVKFTKVTPGTTVLQQHIKNVPKFLTEKLSYGFLLIKLDVVKIQLMISTFFEKYSEIERKSKEEYFCTFLSKMWRLKKLFEKSSDEMSCTKIFCPFYRQLSHWRREIVWDFHI